MQTIVQNEAAAKLLELPAPDVLADTGPQPAADEPSPAAVREQAEATAELILAIAGATVRQGLGVEVDAAQIREGERRLADVLVKYDGELPPWLTRWKEELLFGWWCATTAYGVWRAHLEAKAEAEKTDGGNESRPETAE